MTVTAAMTIQRTSPTFPRPTLDHVGRPQKDWQPTSRVVENIGRLRLTVNGLDVTFFRNVPFVFVSMLDAEPFGDASMVIQFPQIASFEDRKNLGWMPDFASVELDLVDPTETSIVETLFVGQLASIDRGDDTGLEMTCTGIAFSAQLACHQPPFFIDTPIDIGQMVASVMNNVVSRRYNALAGVNTSISTRTKGDRTMTPMSYCQSLLALCTDAVGNIWTVKQLRGTTTLVIAPKDVTTDGGTFMNGTPGLSVKLTEDATQTPNVIYGEWTTPDMARGRNTKYPNLLPSNAPAYPNTSAGNTITVGETDASTDSGRGVTDWQNRMHAIGYTKVPSVKGTYTSSDAVYCEQLQRAAGISVDGVIGPQTWSATFGVGSTSGDLTGAYFAPIAELASVEPFLFTADGGKAGANPAYVVGKMRVERFENLGDGLSRDQAFASAAAELKSNATPGYAGTITASIDPQEKSRWVLRAGENILLKNYDGHDLRLHIASRSFDSAATVTYTVDTKARDAVTLAQAIQRDFATATDPAKQYRHVSTTLATPTHAVWDDESGVGLVPRHALFGGLWNVIRIPVAEYGSIARTIFQTDTPKAQFSIFVFEGPVTAADMIALVGNPLGTGTSWQNATTKDPLFARGLRMAWGSNSQPAGYSPLSFTDIAAPLTGLLDDDASWSYVSQKPPWIWIAEYSPSSCFITGTLEQAVLS